MIRRLMLLSAVLAVLAASATTLRAQSIFDTEGRLAPQYLSYHLGTPADLTVSELAIPLYVLFPINPSLSFDVGTAYASVNDKRSVGTLSTTSSISGLTDTQIRMTYALVPDFLLFTGGVNLPTGSATATPSEQGAAALIASDFLAFPITSMGTGFGGTGGFALAKALGDWNVGGGLSARYSSPYNPYQLQTGQDIRYLPGNEYRVRFGIDHPFGTGHFAFGETYSKFANDEIDTAIYNTGNRFITEAGISNAAPGGDFTLSGWDLYRMTGTLADGTVSGHENVVDLSLVYGIALGSTRIEPMIEGRTLTQVGVSSSMLGTFGIRLNQQFGSFVVAPSVAYSVGSIAAQTDGGVNTTASLTGFKAQLTIRVQ